MVRASFEHERRENKIKDISRDQNVRKFARLFFRPYAPPFQGLTLNGKIERDSQKICDQLGTFF
jgi:hypothetical protein